MQLSESRILSEQLKLSFRHIINSAAPPPLVAVLMVWALSDQSNLQALIIWCAATLLSGFAYIYEARKQLATNIPPENARHVLKRLIIVNIVSGACWGGLPLAAFAPADAASSILVVTVITGVAANAMATLAPVFSAYAAFVLFEMAGLIWVLLMVGETAYTALAIVGALYLVSLLGMASNGAKTTRSTIILRFENSDLVERLKQEKASTLAAYREAEQANQDKSRFLAAASHDLRQPVHAQGLFMDVLVRSGLAGTQQDLLNRIRGSWRASTEMLDALLDISRIEAGVVEPQQRVFHLHPLLTKLEIEFGPQADRKGLVYRCRETMLAVESDPVLVELMLRNLIANAIRYTEQGGILIGCRKRNDKVLLEVWDTGIGMAPEQQRDIFQEFYQVGNSERDRRKGLGLAITDGLAQVLEHPLSLASRLGLGSVFRLALPLTDKPVVIESVDQQPIQSRRLGLSVLVIDDDEAVLAGMQQLLSAWDCDSKAADSLAHALHLTETWQPDLVISDYRLREQKTGADVIKQLRDRLGRNLPAILITGDTAPARIREAEASGIPLLHKPVAANQLYQRIIALTPSTKLIG
ncbi:hybrid sensor histidine kinase/response regulator [Sedimenticola hydrogenitrophicus]|uniref:ATP-binding response regulator n=1 Tax=Sedimenticola hydrogenitrophicus TaxID=2967975 RepID=UPI0021A92352|nr:hybrid sensor histidine kinase/response regulator [Sedimenticola hydrogenitrophicus]